MENSGFIFIKRCGQLETNRTISYLYGESLKIVHAWSKSFLARLCPDRDGREGF